MTDLHRSVEPTLTELRSRYPDTPFLALGQTIWWDEPMKAVLLRWLAETGVGGRLVLGVHDTDYFAKARVQRSDGARFELMPHNDGATKDLWSAAGEISRLFGNEVFPTRHDFINAGVPFRRVAGRDRRERTEFLNRVSEAWGWRGLVYTGSRDLIVNNVSLCELGDALEQMLEWGFRGTTDAVASLCCREKAVALADGLVARARDYRLQHPHARMTDLYQALFPHVFSLLLGSQPQNVSVTSTTDLLRFNPETCDLPRFKFADLFLNNETRALAAAAYNEAVGGSEIYTLDQFGLGALPFDVVLPKDGRGTLRVTLRAVHIETRTPIRIPLRRPLNSARDLAEVLCDRFGPDVTLVGKAVALISMLGSEFIFVFNEEGSGYVTRTRRMNDRIRGHGVPIVAHPILRLHYHTWDSMTDFHARFALPEHLAATMGAGEIMASEFARRWQDVADEQDRLLKRLPSLRQPRALMGHLAESEASWSQKLAEYDEAKARLREIRARAAAIQRHVDGLYRELAEVRDGVRTTEQAKGDHFRATEDWTPDEEQKRETFDVRIAELHDRRRELLQCIARLKLDRWEIERGAEANAAREAAERIEREAEMERVRLVRNAILTSNGLRHAEHRPSAWWLPMVDCSGVWFDRLTRTAEAYIQPVLTEEAVVSAASARTPVAAP